MQPIFEAIAGLLARFADPKHRWTQGKNVIPNTGVFVTQSQAEPWMYKVAFYTPDDIGVQAVMNMRAVLKDRKEIDGLLSGICQFLVAKRHPELIDSQEQIAALAASQAHRMIRKRQQLQVVK